MFLEGILSVKYYICGLIGLAMGLGTILYGTHDNQLTTRLCIAKSTKPELCTAEHLYVHTKEGDEQLR